MKDTILNLYKVAGETPLERIQRFKGEYPEFETSKLSYAGRLDPMAEGVLLVLAGEENKNREKYLQFSKEYTFDALFGVRTDTYDVLGKVVEEPAVDYDWAKLQETIAHYLMDFKGKIIQHYPPYSSKPVGGKPLFEWAKNGQLSEIEIPSKEIEVFNIVPLYTYEAAAPELSAYIFDMISRVRGDFRQRAIIRSWIEFFERNERAKFNILRLKISCSSGTYVRGIVNALGKKVGVPALALKIVRTRIGNYKMEDALM